MKVKTILFALTVLVLGLLAAACSQQATPTLAPPIEAPEEPAEVEVIGSVPDGGKVYDKWWKAAEVDEPTEDQAPTALMVPGLTSPVSPASSMPVG